MPTSDWVAFWNAPHSIYVNARHREAHYRRIAEDVRRYVPAGGTVLDYGCGEANSAQLLAESAGQLILCEAAANVRDVLQARYAGNSAIRVCTPDQVAALPAQSLDLIVLHSVAQYLTPEELDALLALFRRLLKPGGLFVLGDVIPLQVSAATDALALLRFAAGNGFFLAAVAGLIRTVFSNYWRLRHRLGLTRYSEAAVLEKLRAAGFLPKRAATNIGHNPARMTFLAFTVD